MQSWTCGTPRSWWGLRDLHEQFANGFYSSIGWRKCREAFKRSKGGLCERCMARGLITPGTEVHHKVWLTPENLDDPEITLNWANLELLCKQCHTDEHMRAMRGRRKMHGMRTDATGHVEL